MLTYNLRCLLSRGGESQGAALAGVVLAKKSIVGQHHPGATRHPSSAEEGSPRKSSVRSRSNPSLTLFSKEDSSNFKIPVEDDSSMWMP